MTWEETIKYIRTKPEYTNLVKKAYYDINLPLNIDNFIKSEEFVETLYLIKKYQPNGKSILDIGCGNGVSSISFALNGYNVTAVEPDKSNTIGAGAVRWLTDYYKLNNISVYEQFAEEINFPSESFDIVYIRQAMHHAYDLNQFVKEAARVLKKGGLLLTVRDHVIYNEKDKQRFLENHDLHKFYGGENAFTLDDYKFAISNSGLELIKIFKYYDSVINYFPSTKKDIENLPSIIKQQRKENLTKKIGIFSKFPFTNIIYNLYLNYRYGNVLDEKKTPGRMYSFISTKK